MATISYPQTITQTTGGKYAVFNSLANLKNNTTGKHAITKLIKAKSSTPNRPSTVSATNFKLNLPTGARVTSIKVEYRQQLDPYNSKYPAINAPTVSLLGVKGYSKKGTAPNKTLTTRTVTFKPSKTTDFSVTKLNSADFGVKINYPANTNKNSGYLRLSFIRITVNYKSPAYTVGWSSNPKTPEQDSTVSVNLKVSNKNLCDYKPTFTVTIPAGFTVKSLPTNTGTWTKINNRTYTFKPNFTSKVGSVTAGLVFDVNVSGSLPVSATFEAVESLTGANAGLTLTVVEKSEDTGSDSDTKPDYKIGGDDYLTRIEGIEFQGTNFRILWTDEQKEKYNKHGQTEVVVIDGVSYIKAGYISIMCTSDEDGDLEYYGEELSCYSSSDSVNLWDKPIIPHDNFNLTDEWYLQHNYGAGVVVFKLKFVEEVKYFNGSTGQEDTSKKETFYTDIGLVYCNIRPHNPTTPNMSILTLTEEELNRLGDGEVYTVQSYIKQNTTEKYPRDWNKNFRLGVCNTNITTTDDIFNKAEYWSNNQAGFKEYNNVEVEFTYEQEYPLYFLITSDYPEGSQSSNRISYTEPCIIESDYYNGNETNGNYPVPITNMIPTDDAALSSITIPSYENSTPIVIYDLDIEEDYAEDTDTAIRGISVEITIDDYSDCVVTAQLKSPTGSIGERSIVLSEETLSEDNILTIGGIGDLWGFTTKDLENLYQFELILTTQNILTETDNTILKGNSQICFYTETYTEQQQYCTINNEDIRYYGAFITDIDIPHGLETDTDYINIDGTDTNDAYMQSIREKTITMELEIGDNCNLKEATDTLRQLTQLLLTKRDKYNRPIPKQITFSFMPDVYYEYIIEDSFDNPIEISSYNVKIKLTVPSGTAYKTTSTVTNTTGYVQGLAKVNPIISLKPTGNSIEVTETVTEQKFTIHYPETETLDQIMVIDCENRRLYLQNDEDSTERTDITKYVDFNSDWFYLQDNYSFTSTNCYIRTVEYTERW